MTTEVTMKTATRHEIRIDRSKTLAEDSATDHNRWHPDIPPVIWCDQWFARVRPHGRRRTLGGDGLDDRSSPRTWRRCAGVDVGSTGAARDRRSDGEGRAARWSTIRGLRARLERGHRGRDAVAARRRRGHPGLETTGGHGRGRRSAGKASVDDVPNPRHHGQLGRRGRPTPGRRSWSSAGWRRHRTTPSGTSCA